MVTVDDLREIVNEARSLELLQADLLERLHNIEVRLNIIYHTDLPDAMAEAGVSRLDLPANGNEPGVKLEVKPFYRANIAANWEEAKKRAAFNWLEEHGHGDLIKTEVKVALPRGEKQEALAICQEIRDKHGLAPALAETVHTQTLTAWLKEQVETHHNMPPLELFGATVGRVCKLKQEK